MRASFLLVLALALLVGLGVAFAVKAFGLLTPPVVQPVVIAQKVEVVPPVPAVSILVAARNLYEGETVRPGDVRVRIAKPEEADAIRANKDVFPAPTAEAAFFRTAAKNVEADTPIKKIDLSDMKRPDALNTRLAPGNRAVNLALAKINAAGGLIQPSDWVDVYVSTEIGRSDEAGRTPHTGLVARNVQVIAKRDSLFSGFAPLAPNADIPHTLAANPYRAALIEYARTVGTLFIVPVSQAEKQKLDDRKKTAMGDPSKPMIIAIANESSTEYKDEEQRVKDYELGSQSLGAEDLVRVLNLKPIAVPLPPPTPVTVEMFNGTSKTTTTTFGPPAPPAPKAPKYLLFPPGDAGKAASIPAPAPATPRNL